MGTKLRPAKFLIAENFVEGKVIISCNEYPVINGVGDTLDDAMEQLCLALLVHLRGKRTGVPYRMERS